MAPSNMKCLTDAVYFILFCFCVAHIHSSARLLNVRSTLIEKIIRNIHSLCPKRRDIGVSCLMANFCFVHKNYNLLATLNGFVYFNLGLDKFRPLDTSAFVFEWRLYD